MAEKGQPQAGESQRQVESEAPAPGKDAEVVERWRVAAEAAPSVDQVREAFKGYEKLAKQADAAHVNYAKAAVGRACVHGFATVAEELGVTSKQIHTWKRAYLPNVEDLSAIPGREMRREERRIAEYERRLESEKATRQKYEAAQQRLAAIRERTGK